MGLTDASVVNWVDGWSVVGSCPKCGSPVWAKGTETGEPPKTERSCDCATKPCQCKEGKE